jgi:hypothetical protein
MFISSTQEEGIPIQIFFDIFSIDSAKPLIYNVNHIFLHQVTLNS